jgi:hypothetical protein
MGPPRMRDQTQRTVPAFCYLQMLTRHPVRHPLTQDCLIACLEPWLLPSTYEALAAAAGPDAAIRGLIELAERSALAGVFNIGPARASEIKRCLASTGLIRPEA